MWGCISFLSPSYIFCFLFKFFLVRCSQAREKTTTHLSFFLSPLACLLALVYLDLLCFFLFFFSFCLTHKCVLCVCVRNREKETREYKERCSCCCGQNHQYVSYESFGVFVVVLAGSAFLFVCVFFWFSSRYGPTKRRVYIYIYLETNGCAATAFSFWFPSLACCFCCFLSPHNFPILSTILGGKTTTT